MFCQGESIKSLRGRAPLFAILFEAISRLELASIVSFCLFLFDSHIAVGPALVSDREPSEK